ncbi:hypothetical protein L207DRAFT_584621 [Hyaloscypha variabilis F]|uniref:Transmembrane protein n=1 Tax=Hyaloscypha variabilis (strain UAMH 11265 / GT02V1 / F) TaxID=1149755 RepID=A0A2J6RL61_HYAVF|nr:hypothetical protein L207DRAFT_584621 [Hyaloscypha variabilis F]
MALTLRPQTQNGIMVWTPSTLLLHLLWSWQFALFCAGEVLLFFAIATASGLGWAEDHAVPAWAWIIFFVTLLLIITVIAEICAFANDILSPLLYLGLQTLKLVYATVIFVLFVVFFSHSAYFLDLKRFVFGIVVFWYAFSYYLSFMNIGAGILKIYSPPWFITFFLAIFIYLTTPSSVNQKSAESIENGNVEAATERAPLLPTQIPSPRLPSQRIAVQRYPS